MNLTLDNIYQQLRDSVRFYPKQELKCYQPQTWRVIQKSLASEITGTASNFGATICDKDKPYFWSRLWHEKQYNPNSLLGEFPLLYAFEREGVRIDPFGSAGVRYLVTLEVGVLDVWTDNKDGRKCVGCSARTINEIYRDTLGALETCLNYLKEVEARNLNGVQPGWYNKKLIDQALAVGAVQSAEWVAGVSSIGDRAAMYNKDAAYFRIERTTENLYGTAITLRFLVDGCCETTWNFNETDFGVLAHEAGCETC